MKSVAFKPPNDTILFVSVVPEIKFCFIVKTNFFRFSQVIVSSFSEAKTEICLQNCTQRSGRNVQLLQMVILRCYWWQFCAMYFSMIIFSTVRNGWARTLVNFSNKDSYWQTRFTNSSTNWVDGFRFLWNIYFRFFTIYGADWEDLQENCTSSHYLFFLGY